MVLSLIITPSEALIRRSSLSGFNMATDDRDTMKDVSHTAPDGASAKAVWERGRRPEVEEE